MARPDSVIGRVQKAASDQTIINSSRAKDYPGVNDPRLTPEDLPKPDGRPQNRTPLGRAFETMEPKFTNPGAAGRMILKDEMLKAKGVDIGSDSLYPDGETKSSLNRRAAEGDNVNPRAFKDREAEMELRQKNQDAATDETAPRDLRDERISYKRSSKTIGGRR